MKKLYILPIVLLLASCAEKESKEPEPYIQRVEDNQVSCYRVMTGETNWFSSQNVSWICKDKPTK